VLIVKCPVEEHRLVWPQHEVPIGDVAHRQARPRGQRPLDIEIAPGHLLADLIHASLQAVASGDDDAIAVLAVPGQRTVGGNPPSA
jgi:hypothetical protein